MSRMNVATNHPLIPNSQQYMVVDQYVSIHSEDRNIDKYPNSSEFEIELPQDYCNVQSVTLNSWTFPANYNVFSFSQNNTTLIFEITKPYNPTDYGITDPTLLLISDALYGYCGKPFICSIGDGYYTPDQMTTELTNRMNLAVNTIVRPYIQANNPGLLPAFDLAGGYNQFVVAYNQVGQKIWFGNKSDQFVITNESALYTDGKFTTGICPKHILSSFTNWGLPPYLGFTRCSATTFESNGNPYPTFYYGDTMYVPNGVWLSPDQIHSNNNTINIPVYYLECPYKINLLGHPYFYMEIAGMNTIDETSLYQDSVFTSTTNQTNGVVKSAFAKLAVPTTPVTQWFDGGSPSSKVYNPPAERIRKISLRLRYHDGTLVDFNSFPYSFTLHFKMLLPQPNSNYKTFSP